MATCMLVVATLTEQAAINLAWTMECGIVLKLRDQDLVPFLVTFDTAYVNVKMDTAKTSHVFYL